MYWDGVLQAHDPVDYLTYLYQGVTQGQNSQRDGIEVSKWKYRKTLLAERTAGTKTMKKKKT